VRGGESEDLIGKCMFCCLRRQKFCFALKERLKLESSLKNLGLNKKGD
jgi:hypothetical protein